MVHGDDAESHRRRSFTVTTLGSLVVTGKSLWDIIFLMYTFDNSRASTDTIATLDLWLCWSPVECQCGHYLDTDPWGRPYNAFQNGRCGLIAGGYKAVLALHKGDEKYLQKVYRAARTAVSHNVCMSCEASSQQGPLLYTLYGENAAHRNTILDTSTFITKVAGVQTWTRIPGWGPEILGHDWLHVVDLTLIPEAAASTLIELSNEGVFGEGSMDEKLRRAHVVFVRACRQHRIRT